MTKTFLDYQENRSLTEKLMKYVHDTDEMQDKLISLSKVAEASKENYRRFVG